MLIRFYSILFFLAETHGTCVYPEIQDEYDYFSTALYLYSKYNVTVSHQDISHLSAVSTIYLLHNL